MNAIIGYADLASRHLDDPAKLEKYMENIQVCGQNLLMLLNNVLDLARIENDKTEIEYTVSDVETDFRNCIAMFQNQADGKGQTLTVTTHLLYPYVYADIPHLCRRHDPLRYHAEPRRKRGLVQCGDHGCR